ncbi:MAG: hypothetical protein IJK40_08215, partial [Clostridia bacterium]|nr:hypothetical protein [Clostridia bacterium]
HPAQIFLANRQVDGVKSVQSDEKIYCAIRTPELCGVALKTKNEKAAAAAFNAFCGSRFFCVTIITQGNLKIKPVFFRRSAV